MSSLSMEFRIFFIAFIIIISILLRYSWVNKNDKGIYIALGISILLLFMSSITIYKYENAKLFSHIAMRMNYDNLAKELNINYSGDSKLEKNENFNRQFDLVYNRAHSLQINSNIISVPSLFNSVSMAEAFGDVITKIYNIGYILAHEDYLLEPTKIESLSNYLSEIGLILDSPVEGYSYAYRGRRIKMDYDEDQINRVKFLVDKMNEILEDEIEKVRKLR